MSGKESMNADVLKLQMLEKQFNQYLGDYQREFATYNQTIKDQVQNYWATQENVFVKNDAGSLIPDLFLPGISLKDCQKACAQDPKCKYMLFSDSGNGECAANMCMKWTEAAAGLQKRTQPMKRKNEACVGGKGPAETDYLFHGWEKPSWRDMPNENIMQPVKQGFNPWTLLGNADSLAACKAKAIGRNEPTQGVVFYEVALDDKAANQCYSGYGMSSLDATQQEGVYSSVSPYAAVNLKEQAGSLEKLKELQTGLLFILGEMEEIIDKNYDKGGENEKLVFDKFAQVLQQSDKLNADREKIQEMETALRSLDGLNEQRALESGYESFWTGFIVLLLVAMSIFTARRFIFS